MSNILVEEQIQWVLLYVQRESVNIWKENIIEDLENSSLEFSTVGEFLTDLKQEFRNKLVKVAELKKME